jgi:hypothetical protein
MDNMMTDEELDAGLKGFRAYQRRMAAQKSAPPPAAPAPAASPPAPAPAASILLHPKLAAAELKAALAQAGCKDVEAALKLADLTAVKFTEAGDVDAASVAATLASFKKASPYLFPEAAPEQKPKSALDMSEEEYQVAKQKLIPDGESAARRTPTVTKGATIRPGEPTPEAFSRDAREMTDKEYETELRRIMGSGTYAKFGR